MNPHVPTLKLNASGSASTRTLVPIRPRGGSSINTIPSPSASKEPAASTSTDTSIRGSAAEASGQQLTVVLYPGYNPAGPYALPPVQGTTQSQRELLFKVLQANGHTINKYGIKRDITGFILSAPMQLFALDAFWWLFLEHFAAVDFHTMVERTRRNVLVTDSEVLTYMGTTAGLATSQPKRPMKKEGSEATLVGAKATAPKVRSKVGNEPALPPHVNGLRGRLRDAEDIMRVATPSLSHGKLRELANVLDDRVGVAVDSDDEASIASTSSLEYSPRSDISNGTRLSDLSTESLHTIDGVMRVTHFPMTFPSLARLDPAVRSSVVAREQHQLFTRMAAHYAQALQRLAPRHYTIKDAVTRLVPELLAQTLFAAFWQSIPYATQLFDLSFQRDLAGTLSLWIGGIMKTTNPRYWPVHHVLNTVYKKTPKKQPVVTVKANESFRVRKATSNAKLTKLADSGHGRAPSSLNSARTSLSGASPKAGLLDIKASPGVQSTPGTLKLSGIGSLTSRVARRERRLVEFDGIEQVENASFMSVPAKPLPTPHPPATLKPGHLPPQSANLHLDENDEFVLSPAQRRRRAVEQDVAAMRQDLIRMTTTHTFSQLHYTQDTKGRANKEVAEKPSRTANVHQIGPQKRTVQVIKADIDARYRDTVPWYGNPKQRIRLREQQASTAKFALCNWSPLLHRFMLSNGTDNNGRLDSIRWTL
jgi:hypothetical protein